MNNIAIISFIIVGGLLLMCVSSSISSRPTPDTSSEATHSESNSCNHDSCRELRERVESLEEVVRAIVSALSDEKNSHFTPMVGQKILKSRAVRSINSPALSTTTRIIS